MDTKAKLENDLKDAMRSGDNTRKRTIRMVLAAIKQSEIDKQVTLDEAGVIGILQKEVKTRRESLEEAQKAGRVDLAASSEAEIHISCTITNNDIAPTLKVVKTIVNNNGGTVTDPNAFGLKVDGNPVLHNAVNTFAPGAHTVSETGLAGFQAGSWGGDCAANGGVTLAIRSGQDLHHHQRRRRHGRADFHRQLRIQLIRPNRLRSFRPPCCAASRRSSRAHACAG